jgi:ParB-like chromosome segregation protein Spo0J
MTLAFAPRANRDLAAVRGSSPTRRTRSCTAPDQVAKIAASMAEFGWTVPCFVGDDGELIAGHGTRAGRDASSG